MSKDSLFKSKKEEEQFNEWLRAKKDAASHEYTLQTLEEWRKKTARDKLRRLREKTAGKGDNHPCMEFSERDVFQMLELCSYYCHNRPYLGYDDAPHQKCNCAANGKDGLPICKSNLGHECDAKTMIGVLRKKLSEFRKTHGGTPVSPKVDGGTVGGWGLKVCVGKPRSEDIPNPNEATPKQIRFAEAIARTLGVSLPFRETKIAYSNFISKHKEAFQKKVDEIAAERDNVPDIEEDTPFDPREFC